MAGLLGVSMIGAALYCCVRLLVPRLQVPRAQRGLETWHLVMVSAMAGMLLAGPTVAWPRLGAAVFLVGLGWALFEVGKRHLRAAHLRLAVGCTAMVAMLLPAPVSAAPMPSDMKMSPSMQHAMGTTSTVQMSVHHHAAALPLGVTPLLVAALVVVLVVSLRRLTRRTTTRPDRVGAVCEGAMALAMGYMLLV